MRSASFTEVIVGELKKLAVRVVLYAPVNYRVI